MQLMLGNFQKLLEHRIAIDTNDRSSKSAANKALWHDKLAELDDKYHIEKFVEKALDIEPSHPNADLVNRLLDIFDVLRED